MGVGRHEVAPGTEKISDKQALGVTFRHIVGCSKDGMIYRTLLPKTGEGCADETFILTANTFSTAEWRSLQVWEVRQALEYSFEERAF